MGIRLSFDCVYQLVGDGVTKTFTFDLRNVLPVSNSERFLPTTKPDSLLLVQAGALEVSGVLNGWNMSVSFVNAPADYNITHEVVNLLIVLGYNG